MIEGLKQRVEACDSLYYDADGIPPDVATMGTLRALIVEIERLRGLVVKTTRARVEEEKELEAACKEITRLCDNNHTLQVERDSLWDEASAELKRLRLEIRRLTEERDR